MLGFLCFCRVMGVCLMLGQIKCLDVLHSLVFGSLAICIYIFVFFLCSVVLIHV
jgi:hypothetical protein